MLKHTLSNNSLKLQPGVKLRRAYISVMLICLNFVFEGKSPYCNFMPGIFENNDIVTNNITSSHLNDNFVSLCIFLCMQRAATAMWVI